MKKKIKKLIAILIVSIAVLTVLGYYLLCNDKPPNILLITIDTLRADHLGCYGYQLDTSPTIDRLAKKGILFTDCAPQWPQTLPSMAALNTGLYPKTMGIKYGGHKLPSSFLLMSEIFSQAGYRTGAVVANFNIGKTFGFNQGFDHFVESWQEMWKEKKRNILFYNYPGKVKHFTNATIMVDQALKWLEESKNEKPFYLWLHYMDPHGPYLPPKSHAGYFNNKYTAEPVPLEELPPYQLQTDDETGLPITDLAFYQAQYDREIRFIDDELGRLFSDIKQYNSDRNTIIILTSDHGESLSEHNYYLEHGKLPYQACAHIPLIIADNTKLSAGLTFKKPVGLIDVSATILELAGIAIPQHFEGQSLAPLMRKKKNAAVPKYTFMESGRTIKDTQLTVRYGKWKLIHVRSLKNRKVMAGTEYELYDIKNDPSEIHNLVTQHPKIVKRLGKVLHDWYTSGPRPSEQNIEVDINSLDPKAVEMLKSLGYVE